MVKVSFRFFQVPIRGTRPSSGGLHVALRSSVRVDRVVKEIDQEGQGSPEHQTGAKAYAQKLLHLGRAG